MPSSDSRICCFNLSKKRKFVIFHILDSIFLLTIQLVQGAVLNHYISTDKDEEQYILYALDIFCSLIFVTALFSSYRYLLYYIENNEYPDKRYAASPKRIFSQFPTSKLGVLPLSYLSWVVYVVILLIKIQIIFGADLFVNLNKHDSFAPQLLKVSWIIIVIHCWHNGTYEFQPTGGLQKTLFFLFFFNNWFLV